ncbi:MAG: hypothetical protein WBE79_01060 [Candidatus Cybelea sp.]
MPFTHVRYASLALVAALAACAGSSSTTPALPANALERVTANGEHTVRVGAEVIRFGGPAGHTAVRRGWTSPAASGAVLYGASYDGGFINIYPLNGANQAPIGQLTSGLVSPQGVIVDSRHRLWVANTNAFNIVAFQRGATTPFRTLNDPGYYPTSIAVDTHGTVFAANAEGTAGPPGNVTFWKAGHTKASGKLTFSNFQIVTNIGVDSSDNVYVSYVPKSGPPSVVEFPAGSRTGQQLSIGDANLGDITFDSAKNLVMETLSNTLGVWAPPYTSGPTRTIPAFGNEPTFNKRENKVWIAYANNSEPKIEAYNYVTGKLTDTITNGWTATGIPYGLAIDPPAPL